MRSAAPFLLAAALVFGAAPARAADKSDAKAPVHKITQSTSYMMIDPIYTTISSDNRAVGLLMIGVGLDVPNDALRAQADHALPVLRDGYVRSLMAFSASSVRPTRQPNVSAIADRLQGVTDRLMGRKGARILLAQVAMRLSK